MTFEEYKQGLKDVAKKHDDLDVRLYNINVKEQCDFKVHVAELVKRIEQVSNLTNASVGTSIRLSPRFSYGRVNEALIGEVIIGITYNQPNTHKPVVEQLAKFVVDENTMFVDGSTLKDNTYIQRDYGRIKLRLMPNVDINNLIVGIDTCQEYMYYPVFLKALFRCNIIENNEQTHGV